MKLTVKELKNLFEALEIAWNDIDKDYGSCKETKRLQKLGKKVSKEIKKQSKKTFKKLDRIWI